MKQRFAAALLLATTLLVAGCDSAEERAQKHFQTGLDYYQSGDTRRAALEFRNVLQLAPAHQEALLMLADIARANGNLPGAVGYYRTLLENYPELGESHLALAEIALDLGDWSTVATETPKAAELLPPQPAIAALQANLAYRDALQKNDVAARRDQAEAARKLVEANPDLASARRLVIDSLLRDGNLAEALEVVDAGIAIDAKNYPFYQARLGILQQLGLTADITAQLQQMVTLFPKEETVPPTLVRWYVEQGDLDAAEAFLRERAAAEPENLDRQTDLARFLKAQRGFDAVNAELERLSAQGDANAGTYRAMRAALMFENGQTDAAIAELEALLAAQPEDQKHSAFADDVRVDLARMRVMTGDKTTAKALVDEVLQNDATQTAALKMRAAWMIEEDKIEDAIIVLRSALRESPRDPQIMTLMASAHDRAGDLQLKREMLSLAVEASRNAPEESLRYAQELIATKDYRAAEDVLLNALRLRQDNVQLYAALGQVYVALQDWNRASQILQVLDQLDTKAKLPQARQIYNSLQAQVLAGQKKDEEFFGFLEGLANEENGLAAEVAIIRAHAARGEIREARERLNQALEKDPGNPMLLFLDASVKAVDGQYAEAEAGYRVLLAQNPKAEGVWMALYRLKLIQKDEAGARAVLEEALNALPDAPNLLFTRAAEIEQAGDYDGAIAIYETLYARDSNSEAVANNLASLLSIHRDDPETIERAYRIGRRLQGSDVPAFRETYGWLAARKGNFDEAERHLAYALKSYAQNPIVQFHYAVALAGLSRNAEALDHFRQAVALSADTSVLSAADRKTAEAEIARLEPLVGPAGTAPSGDAAPEAAPAAGTTAPAASESQ